MVRMMSFNPVAGQMVGGKTWVIEDDKVRSTEDYGL
jgi:hypothetical protein